MRGIESAFWGTLGRDPELRTSRAGKPYCILNLAVVSGKTDDGKDVTQWVRATCFGETASKISIAQKGDRIYVEGTLKLDEWNAADGQARHGLSISAWKAEKVSAIGKSRERRADADYHRPIETTNQNIGFNDEIPF
jgi:single-strand DNA-binding protein